MRLLFATVIIAVVGSVQAASLSSGTTLPRFLPSHYAELLSANGLPLQLVSQDEQAKVKLAQYASLKGDIQLNIEQMVCDRPRCDALYQQTVSEQNAKLTPLAARFLALSPVEFSSEWKEGTKWYFRYVAKVPTALTSWTWISKKKALPDRDKRIAELRRALNSQRYTEAMQMDNVEIGRWSQPIHQHALDLLAQGDTEAAVAVLQQVISWAPNSFQAQLDFAKNTRDSTAARASAEMVRENAETPELTAQAAQLLGQTEPDPASLPLLEAGLRGLQVVLVPLPPCDLRLIEEAGRLYSENLKVPVRVARISGDWQWGKPDRIHRQRDVEYLIQRKSSKPVDFSAWTRDTYMKNLLTLTAKEDALNRFQIESLLAEVKEKPGQYRAEFYVDRLIDIVTPLRSVDRRTMIVGVTEADIFGGDANFLFSGATHKNGNWGAILSYARMQATVLNEPYQSRKRLVERLAKELVPASLKQLGIARPIDPTDPYSYSSGVDRLSQKTLTLSAPTRAALDRFKTP